MNPRPSSSASTWSQGSVVVVSMSSGSIIPAMSTNEIVPRTLLVTNDYPPRVGGIQRTLEALWKELPPERVSVLAPTWEGAGSFDAAAPYRGRA